MCVGVVKTPRRSISIRCMLESVMIIRLATGAMVEVVVPSYHTPSCKSLNSKFTFSLFYE